MGTRPDQVEDEKFSNWVKDTLALLYTKECLEVIADERSAVFYGQLMIAVGNNSTCTCSWQDLETDRRRQKWVVKNCPGVCQKWLDLIISHHSNRSLPKLAPRNTDPSLWPSDTWEVMKVYQSNGCQGHHSARDADVAALIDLMRNCDHFAPLITNPSLINQVKTVRNNLMHSKDFKVENQELSHDLQSMLSFLRSLTAITGASSLSTTEHQAVQTAITEVDKLRTSILDMTLNRELQLKALKAKQIALETDMKLLEQSIKDARKDTEAVKSGLTDVEDKMTEQQQSAATDVSNLAHLQQQFDDLKLDHDGTKKNIKALKQQISYLEESSQKQHRTLDSHETQLHGHQSHIESQNKTLDSHQTQLQCHQSHIASQNKTLDSHSTQLQCHQSHIESQHKTLDSHATQLQGHQSHIESQNKTLDSHATQLQGHQSHIESQNKTLDSHATQLQGHQSHIESQNKTLDSHGTQLQGHQSHIESQNRTLDSHETQLQGHQSHIESQNKTLDSHATQLQGHQSHTESQNRTLDSHETQLQGHQSHIESQHKTLDSHETQLQGHQSHIESQQKTLDSHGAKLDRLENKQPDQAVDIKGLQRKLIKMYEARRQHFPVYLLRSERTIRLEDIYVEQLLKVVDPDGRLRTDCTTSNRRHQARSGFIQIGAEGRCKAGLSEHFISSLKDVFYSKGNKCQYVHVSGNAGYGKSVFCSHLVRLWCKAHSGNITALTRDEDLMTEFPLLFCVDLRDATYKGTDQMPDEICSLIQKQLQLLQLGLNDNDLGQLLQSEGQVLVVMDALDECKEERLPRRGLYNNCTTFVTSRPWKFEALRCDQEYKVDKEIEIVGLKKGSPEHLSEKLVGLLNKKWNKSKMSLDYIMTMRSEGLEDFLDVPLLLTSLLCLWFDEVSFGRSRCEIYKNSIHHQILEAVKVKDIPGYSCSCDVPFPFCQREKCPCKCYEELLWKVSELACNALLGNVRERSLVMDHDQIVGGLTDEEVAICMKIGILTQYKLLGNVTDYEPQKSVSFTHKTYQEWFAAIYLAFKLPLSELDKLLSAASIDIDCALDLDQMFLFVCGLNEEVAARLSEFIMSKVSSDLRVQEYRSSDHFYTSQCSRHQLICSIQELIVAGAVEAKRHKQMSTALQLHDVYIVGGSMHNRRFSTEQILACDISHARSVCISSLHIENISLPVSSCLEKLDLRNVTNVLDDAFCCIFSAAQLVNLHLWDFTLTHDQLENLYENVALAGSLRTVDIGLPTCITHKRNRQDCSIMLDLSQHQGLEDMYLELDAQMQVEPGNIRMSLSLASAGSLRSVSIIGPTCITQNDSKQDCSIMLDLSQHQGLEDITLYTFQEVSLGQNMDNMAILKLNRTKMTHAHIECLNRGLASAGNLRTLKISELTCITHKDSRKDCSNILDLSQHQGLESLELIHDGLGTFQEVSLCQNMDNMAMLDLHRTKMTHAHIECLNRGLASAENLRTLKISELTCITHKDSRNDCSNILDLSQHQGLESLELINDGLGTFQEVSLCQNMDNIKMLKLHRTNMTHGQLEILFFRGLASAGSLRTLNINKLICITHKYNRHTCSVMLNLSQRQGLENLTLRDLGVGVVRGASLCQNMDTLSQVELGGFCISASALRQIVMAIVGGGPTLVKLGGYYGVYSPLKMRGAKEAKQLLEDIRQVPYAHVTEDDVKYTGGNECVVKEFVWNLQ